MIQATHKQTSVADIPAAPARSTANGAGANQEFGRLFLQQTGDGAGQAATSAASQAAAVQTVATAPNLPASFAPAAIEAHLNQWLMGVIERQNQARMEVYNQAVENWRLNSARHRELGLPQPPPPEPPVLEAVQPMPDGWWFETHA